MGFGQPIKNRWPVNLFVSIGQDGTPFIDKGLVRPEHRKQLARLLEDDTRQRCTGQGEAQGQDVRETLRRDLAAYRLQAARVEIASHPAIALDLLVFKAASETLDPVNSPEDGPDVGFNEPKVRTMVEAKACHR